MSAAKTLTKTYDPMNQSWIFKLKQYNLKIEIYF